jgi:signal transduction histidine kinase/CheY-like chemotaxis protein
MTFEEATVMDGARRIWNSTRGVYRDGTGAACGVIGISRDVTELRQLEEQLRQSQKIEAVGRLASGIAHDFNNLLAIIKSYADFLVQSLAPDDSRHDDVEEIRAAADRAAALTRQLLVFSRRQEVAPAPLDLNRVVSDMERMLRPLLIHGVELRLMLEPALWPARADAGQMEQVLLNLAVNARDAMPEGGVLAIDTGNMVLDEHAARARGELRPGDYVSLAVRDTGIGMDEAVRAHIFEPFFTTKPLGQGTGLGLPTVWAIVQAAGGHVDITSAPGRGTTVRVLLPRARDDEEEPEARPRAESAAILVVDDDPQMRDTLARLLGDEGYAVRALAEPAEAMRIAARLEEPLDLVLADDLMPTMTGGALARQLATLRPDARVLLVSSAPRPESAEHHSLPPNARLVPRTASPDELLAAVREALASPPPQGAAEGGAGAMG